MKQRQKQYLTLSRGNGIEVVQQVLRIQTKEGAGVCNMSALALIKRVQKFRQNNPNIFKLEHLTILKKL